MSEHVTIEHHLTISFAGGNGQGNTESLAHLIRHFGEKLMATLQDVKDALAQAATDATAEKAEVATALDALNAQITDLKTQIGSGSVVSAADLDALLASIQGIDAQVKAITVPAVPA